MSIHSWASVWPILTSISELSGYHTAKLHILTAAAPLPALTWRSFPPCVAAADGDGALGASPRHSERYPRWGNCMDKCWFSSGYGSGQRKHALLHMLYLRMSINCSFICPDIIVTLKVLKLLNNHERVVKLVGKDSSLRSHCGHGMPWVREDQAYPSRWGKYKADKSIIRKT